MGNKYYLKTFNNKTEYESQKNSVMYTPHVVLLNDTEEVVYASNARKKASNDYFTITALDNGYLVLITPQFGGSQDGPMVASIEPQQELYSFKYRKNKGDWEESVGAIRIDVKPGDTVQISCESNSFKYDNYGDYTLLSPSNVRFDVSGNIMSLIYGDDFIGQTTLKSEECFCSLLSISNVVSAKNLILPATTLAEGCYSCMFKGCTSLTSAPELPATTLASDCYYSMFFNCTGLTTAPSLPATTLANGCYSNMFNSCTSLTTAPSLPATTLANGCYSGMFEGCTSLTTAPALPATTLVESCYESMFFNCSSLTTAPELPAKELASYCYGSMFDGCSSLNHITMLATDISASYCLINWVDGVASSGTFAKNPSMTSLPSGESGIPYGWSVVDYNPSAKEYFTIESLEDGLTVSFSNGINDVSYGLIGIEYSINNGVWNSLSSEVETPTVNTGDKISFRGNAIHDPEVMYNFIGQFTISKKCSLHGNIMSLLYDTDFEYKTDLNGFNCAFGIPPVAGLVKPYGLFCDCTNIIDASDLILPATTLSQASYCFMFFGCTGLTTAPVLPATELTEWCYCGMFYGCTGLTTAPVLPAITLTYNCYTAMFYDCSKLNHIEMLATDNSTSDCLINWVSGVASSGTFVKSPYMTSLPSGQNGIPEGWNVENINGAPDVGPM